jgi:hypothetical protein
MGETRGRNTQKTLTLKGLNIKLVQPLSGLMVRYEYVPRVSPAVIEIKHFQAMVLKVVIMKQKDVLPLV